MPERSHTQKVTHLSVEKSQIDGSSIQCLNLATQAGREALAVRACLITPAQLYVALFCVVGMIDAASEQADKVASR